VSAASAAVLDRIKKLLALAADASNEHEAALAAARAQELLLRHQLSESDLPNDQQEPIGEHPLTAEEGEHPDKWGRIEPWRMSLAVEIAEALNCVVLAIRTARRRTAANLKIAGRRSDCEAATYLYRYLAREVNRLADAWWEERLAGARELSGKPKGVVPRDKVLRYKTSFRVGAIATIGRRLKEARAVVGAESSQTGLVLASRLLAVNQWVDAQSNIGSFQNEHDNRETSQNDQAQQ
jgi:hypothetical protein